MLVLSLALAAATSVGGHQRATGGSRRRRRPSPRTPLSSKTSSRLWRANLSEEFITKYVAHSDLARDLTADDVVRLRAAGVPETLIASITLRRPEPGLAAGVMQSPGPGDSRRWDGLTRRNSGIVLFKSRWDAGVLEFKEGSLRWIDSKDAAKNVLLPAAQMTEQQLTCLKKAGGNECFEWV